MAFCGVCCANGGDAEISAAPGANAGPGFSSDLDKALGGPGKDRSSEAVADADRRTATMASEATAAASVTVRASQTFQVSIPKGDRKLCIDINFHDQQTLLLTKVNEGPILDFNRENPSQELAPGDRIEVLNGVRGDAQAMLDACRTSSTLSITAQRCEERTIHFVRSASRQKLGLSSQIVDMMTLIVTKIDDEGLVAEHNAKQPEYDIDREDRIIGVNGVRSNAAKLLQTIETADEWQLVVRRIWPDE